MAFEKKRQVFFVVVFLLGNLGEGCAPKTPTPKLCFVHMQALLPYSPSLTAASLRPAISSAMPTISAIAFSPYPAPFVFPPPIGATLAHARRQQLDADAARYLQRYKEALQDAAQLDFTRYQKEQQLVVQQKLQKAAESIRTQVMNSLQSQLRALDRQELLLQFRQTAVQTQIRATSGPFANSQAHQDALSQQQLIAQQIAQVATDRKQLLAEAEKKIDQTITQTRQQLEADLQNLLKAYRTQQEAEIAQRAAQAAKNQQALLQEVNLALPTVPQAPAPKVSLPPKWTAPSNTALQAAQARFQDTALRASAQSAQMVSALAQMQAKWLHQQVLSIVQQQGWKLVPEGTPGAFDATDFVKAQLQKEREFAAP